MPNGSYDMRRIAGTLATGLMLALAVLTIVTQILGFVDVALAPTLATPLGLAVIAFWCWAPGWVVVRRAPWVGRGVIAVGVSVAILGLASAVAVWSGWWYPREATLVVAVLTIGAAWVTGRGVHGRESGHLRAALAAFPRRARAALAGAAVPAVLLALGLIAWGIALPAIDTPDVGRWGLLVSGPPAFGIALGLVVVAFLAALRIRRTGWMAAALLSAVAVERGTGSLVLDAPSVDWAYKHLGVVDLFASHGQVDWGLDIYQGWPSFFSGVATLQEAADISAFSIARWFTLAIAVATALAVRALVRAVGRDEITALTAAALALVVNWVYQDYFSPQAVAVVLAVIVLAVLLHSPRERHAVAVALFVFTALVTTHQLTPVWLLGALVALTILRRVPWWITGVMILIMLGEVAVNFDIIRGYGLFSQLDVVSNARTTAAFDLGSVELDWHQRANRVATLGLWSLSALVAIVSLARTRSWRWFRGQDALAAVLAFSPFAILVAQSYGGEAILRVMLYSIVGCSLLLAPRIVTAVTGTPIRALIASGVVLLLTASAGHAYFSTFGHYAVTATEYEVATMLERDLPGKAYMSPISSYWPVRPTAEYAWRLRDDAEYDASLQNKGSGIRSNDYIPRLEEYLENRDSPTYVLFGARMDAYADYRGIIRRGSITALRDDLAQRDGWELIWQRDGVTVLRYVPEKAVDQPAARWQP